LLAENNIPLKAITHRVGHKDNGKTTMEIYTHVTKNAKSRVVDVLNNLLNNLPLFALLNKQKNRYS